MTTVAIVGCTGMLGAMTLRTFVEEAGFAVRALARDLRSAADVIRPYAAVELRGLDAEKADRGDLEEAIRGVAWVVNAAGVIKPHIHDDDPRETERAIRVNSLFPYLLARAAGETGARVVQIATDCVFSGDRGRYTESDAHDARDVYGRTKSLGESYLPNIRHLRCSIVGPEQKGRLSLLSWFLGNTQGAEVKGFTNHAWNGVTSLHFARLVAAVIRCGIELPHVQHVVPGSVISKANLLRSFAREFKRSDLRICDVEASTVIDRTLATENPELNAKLWEAAGYPQAPSIEQMVAELGQRRLLN